MKLNNLLITSGTIVLSGVILSGVHGPSIATSLLVISGAALLGLHHYLSERDKEWKEHFIQKTEKLLVAQNAEILDQRQKIDSINSKLGFLNNRTEVKNVPGQDISQILRKF